MTAISRGTSGNLLFDMQADIHTQEIPGWAPELALYNAVQQRGFSADGKTLKMSFAQWQPGQRRLSVDMVNQLQGGSTGYLGTSTDKFLQTAAQNVQGQVVLYDFAGIANSFQYDTILEILNSSVGQDKSYLRKILVQQLVTFKNNANLIMCTGKYAQVCAGATFAAAAKTISIAPGNSVQNLYVGQLVTYTLTADSTTHIVTGAPVDNYYGMISAIAEDGNGGYTISYTDYDGSATGQMSTSATTVHLFGQYGVSPWGLLDFVTADNTVGDLARSGRYNPTVKAAADIAKFVDDPAYGIVQMAEAIRRNTSGGVKINCVMMSKVTFMWYQFKYSTRQNFDQAQRAMLTGKAQAFGFNPIWAVDPDIAIYVVDSIPDGEMYLLDTNNLGFTPLPGNTAPTYLDMLPGGTGEGLRVHGTMNKETALVWFYQMYARHLGGFGRIHSISFA